MLRVLIWKIELVPRVYLVSNSPHDPCENGWENLCDAYGMFLATSGISLTPSSGVSPVLSYLFSPESLRVPDDLSSYVILVV